MLYLIMRMNPNLKILYSIKVNDLLGINYDYFSETNVLDPGNIWLFVTKYHARGSGYEDYEIQVFLYVLNEFDGFPKNKSHEHTEKIADNLTFFGSGRSRKLLRSLPNSLFHPTMVQKDTLLLLMQ